ncbi:hypothetical protein HWB92_gp101 [Serratia phage vB_SmaA_3M]|uniref:Uncharacterized protein n=3 Tax=Miltonvirus TaxID=2841278 RepID=K7YIU5_9CAUD|nr:hypothetical protein G646_gp098 [Serratia phage phiMAM1]YP_009841969.1 hypothetical protein HWB92_gp101 [Serratia phage vB_SmaA_3M]AFX93566.1 hypothetical protein MAM_098 [Serratia phage phiMAM1]ASZ78874.1 hypothetical protein 2050H1_108 [Serratia phage 2050H1]AYP28359.1 hypothetical protein 3M_103 [Serratia phage vB_SmaA_3M]
MSYKFLEFTMGSWSRVFLTCGIFWLATIATMSAFIFTK